MLPVCHRMCWRTPSECAATQAPHHTAYYDVFHDNGLLFDERLTPAPSMNQLTGPPSLSGFFEPCSAM